MSANKMSTSIPWYSTEQDYKEILELVPPSESAKALPYKDFVAYLEKLERGVALGGQFPVRVEIKADAVKAWCKDNNQAFCRKSISEYSAIKMMEKIRTGNN